MSYLATYSDVPAHVRALMAGQTGGLPALRRQERHHFTTAPTPEDTSIFLAELMLRGSFDWRTDINGSFIKETEARLRRLQEFYTLANAEDVRRFLREHPDAADVMFEAQPHIKRIFGPDTQVVLEVISDPDSEELRASEELFGNIQTSLPVEEALAQLSKFDDEWFLLQLARAGGRLNFNLEFV